MNDIRIGTSGWHYPSGAGTWNGRFYPKPRPKGFDELAFYAERFTTVEVNTTFYGQPRPDVTRQWVERTPAGFEFAVKLYQQFTHPKLFQQRVTKELAKTLGTTEIPEDVVAALITANRADLDEFRRGIEPLATAGKLGPLLAQFPASFRDTPANRAHLASLLRAFPDQAVAVELRHRSWSDQADATWALLDAFGAAWTWIDEPKFKDSVRQPFPECGTFVYLRLHGRNAKAWWKGDRDERYNYLYTAEELEPVAERLRTMRPNRAARAYMNNHFSAKAVVNARVLEELAQVRTEDESLGYGAGVE